jgi:energy-coupling factor transporter ATP-binding protein EcfA2
VATRVARALAGLGLEAVADQHPYDLPPPMRKLAALAGALALEPVLLLLDEPTAGLDHRARTRVTETLAERAAAGAALLVITHDLGFAAETLDRALVLERGRLAADAPLADLLTAGPDSRPGASRRRPLPSCRPPFGCRDGRSERAKWPTRSRSVAARSGAS